MSNIDYNKPPYGYALRRKGSCISDEKDCGPTWGHFHVCCPRGTKCPSNADGSVCCKSESDCSPLMTEPHCADEYGVLYLSNKYFCCSNQTIAFKRTDEGTNANGWVGCAFDVQDAGANTQLLLANDTVNSTSSTPSSTPHATLSPSSSTSIKTTTATTPTSLLPSIPTNASSIEEDSPTSSSKIGAIAGGTVGGVAGLAILGVILWFLIRRRNNEKIDQPPFRNSPGLSTSAVQFGEGSNATQAGELDISKDYVAELPGQRTCGY